MEREPLLKPDQAADRLGCSLEQLWAWVKEGRLARYRIGSLSRFDPDLSIEPDAADEPETTDEPESIEEEQLEELVSTDLLESVAREAGISEGTPVVYVVEAGEGGPIKIGFCGQFGRIRTRLAGIQTGCPALLRLLWLIEGGLDLETRLHGDLATHRIRGEWFEREALERVDGLTLGRIAWSREMLAPGYAGGLT